MSGAGQPLRPAAERRRSTIVPTPASSAVPATEPASTAVLLSPLPAGRSPAATPPRGVTAGAVSYTHL
ncbi:hypothetical protein, partial [Streptomyces sp. rh195]|uniref:hypothetical protein n=1 Tax=Streptomyces sp. rh195 TaxID=2034271 RepID=UPI00359C8F22